MKVIGLCGGSGAGKSAFCEALSRRGVVCIDCDEIAHSVQEKGSPCFLELCEAFGGEILFPDGALNRQALASAALSDEEKQKTLNRITHRHILKELRRRLKALGEDTEFVVVEAPLLFESGFDRECDLVVALLSDQKEARIIERDRLAAKDARARLSAQTDDAALREMCDICIENDGALLALEQAAEELIATVRREVVDA